MKQLRAVPRDHEQRNTAAARTRKRPLRPMGQQGEISGPATPFPPPKKSPYLRRERRGSFSKFGGLGFRYRAHSDRRL